MIKEPMTAKEQCEYFDNVKDNTLCPNKATHKIRAADGRWYRCCDKHFTEILHRKPDIEEAKL